MQTETGNLFTRNDTMFGICQALGQDLGFNPIWLRVTFGVLLLWNPVMVIGAYAALGAIVLLSRLVFPNRSRPAAVEPALLTADNDAESLVLAQAA